MSPAPPSTCCRRNLRIRSSDSIAAWRTREPWLEGRLTAEPARRVLFACFAAGHADERRGDACPRYLRTGDLANCVNREFLVKRMGVGEQRPGLAGGERIG